MSEESVEALLGLERISASCSPMTMSTFATLSAILAESLNFVEFPGRAEHHQRLL